MNEDNCARLEKIQGGVDLINEKLTSSNQLANERHETMKAEIAQLKRTDDLLGERVGALEADKNVRSGERQGLALSGRILWTIIGAVPVGVGAVILKLVGA